MYIFIYLYIYPPRAARPLWSVLMLLVCLVLVLIVFRDQDPGFSHGFCVARAPPYFGLRGFLTLQKC